MDTENAIVAIVIVTMLIVACDEFVSPYWKNKFQAVVVFTGIGSMLFVTL